MASRFDLEPRIARLKEWGLVVKTDYRGDPPAWLSSALDECDVFVLNVKGIPVDDTIVMVPLAFLLNLLAAVEESLTAKEPA
jgi:hypothetical protein